MFRYCRALVMALSVLLSSGSAWALDVDFGDIAIRNLTSFGFNQNTSGNVMSYDAGATDELYQLFGYLGNASGVVRIDGSSFDVDTDIDSAAAQIAANHFFSELSVASGNGLGLAQDDVTVRYDWILRDDSSPQDHDHVDWSISLTNNTAAVQSLVLYTYLDLDLGGASDFADDTAVVATGNPAAMRISDADEPTREVSWNSYFVVPDHYQVGVYPSIRNLLDGMPSATDLNDSPPTGTTVGPADFTAAFQYNLTILPGETVRISQAIPEPSATGLLLVGIAGLLSFPRLARAGRRLAS